MTVLNAVNQAAQPSRLVWKSPHSFTLNRLPKGKEAVATVHLCPRLNRHVNPHKSGLWSRPSHPLSLHLSSHLHRHWTPHPHVLQLTCQLHHSQLCPYHPAQHLVYHLRHHSSRHDRQGHHPDPHPPGHPCHSGHLWGLQQRGHLKHCLHVLPHSHLWRTWAQNSPKVWTPWLLMAPSCPEPLGKGMTTWWLVTIASEGCAGEVRVSCRGSTWNKDRQPQGALYLTFVHFFSPVILKGWFPTLSNASLENSLEMRMFRPCRRPAKSQTVEVGDPAVFFASPLGGPFARLCVRIAVVVHFCRESRCTGQCRPTRGHGTQPVPELSATSSQGNESRDRERAVRNVYSNKILPWPRRIYLTHLIVFFKSTSRLRIANRSFQNRPFASDGLRSTVVRVAKTSSSQFLTQGVSPLRREWHEYRPQKYRINY